MRKNTTAHFLATACLALSLAAGSAFAIEIKEGKEYAVLPQTQPTDAKGKIEVTEFFWYGCPHCFEFEPTLNAWVKTLPKDVAFRRVPADFGRNVPLIGGAVGAGLDGWVLHKIADKAREEFVTAAPQITA